MSYIISKSCIQRGILDSSQHKADICVEVDNEDNCTNILVNGMRKVFVDLK